MFFIPLLNYTKIMPAAPETPTLEQTVVNATLKSTPEGIKSEDGEKPPTVSDFLNNSIQSLADMESQLNQAIAEMEAQRGAEAAGSPEERTLQTSIAELRNYAKSCRTGMENIRTTLHGIADGSINPKGFTWKKDLERTQETLQNTRVALMTYRELLEKLEASGNSMFQEMFRKEAPLSTQILIAGFDQFEKAMNGLVKGTLGIIQPEGVAPGTYMGPLPAGAAS
jgi:hypothetical protein